MSDRPLWWALVGIACVLAAWLAMDIRSAVHPGGSGDFGTVYAATRAWVHGKNPYDQHQLDREWAAAGGSPGVAPTSYWTPSVYPPGTMLLVAPIAAPLRWSVARAVWDIIDTGLVISMFAVLPRLAGLRWNDLRGMGLICSALLLGPVRAGIAMGQPVVATASLIVLTAAATGAGRDGLGGVLLLIAMTLKPQVAGPFVAYYLLRRRWKLTAIAIVGFTAISIAAAARLWVAGVPWFTALQANLHSATVAGGINDPTWLGPNRFSMVNLQVLLHTFSDNRLLVNVSTIAFLLAGALMFAVIVYRRGNVNSLEPSANPADLPARGLAELAFVAAWSLMAVYHRWYDGELLILLLAWAAAAMPFRRWRLMAGMAAVFTLPFVASLALKFLPGRRTVPQRYSLFMEHFILPNQCWALCAICILLLFVLWRRPEVTPREIA